MQPLSMRSFPRAIIHIDADAFMVHDGVQCVYRYVGNRTHIGRGDGFFLAEEFHFPAALKSR
jgi:hypothetical protein